jgi:hypothetical protein
VNGILKDEYLLNKQIKSILTCQLFSGRDREQRFPPLGGGLGRGFLEYSK